MITQRTASVPDHTVSFSLLARVLGCMGCTLALVCLCMPAFAQEDDKARAKQHFGEGVSAYEAGHYEQALSSFQEAYRLKPHPLVRVNIANCYDRLDRPVEAIFHFELFLESKEGSPAQRTEVKNALKELHKRVGKLTLNVSPDGARITIDEGEARRAPIMEAILLKVGEHKVVVHLDGYDTLTRSVDVKGDVVTEVSLRLSRTTVAPVVAAVPAPAPEAPAPAETSAAEEKSQAEPVEAQEEDAEEAEEPAEAPKQATAPSPEQTEAQPSSSKTGIWIAAGTTVVLAGAAIVTGLLAKSADRNFNANLKARFDDALTVPQQAQAWSNATDSANRARSLAIATDVLFGASAVAAVTTLVLVLTHHSQPTETALAPVLDRHGAGLAWRGNF